MLHLHLTLPLPLVYLVLFFKVVHRRLEACFDVEWDHLKFDKQVGIVHQLGNVVLTEGNLNYLFFTFPSSVQNVIQLTRMDSIYCCNKGKDNNCHECRLAMCSDCVEACRSFASKRGRRAKQEIQSKEGCNHNVVSLDMVENAYWASDSYNDDHNFPEGCIVCMKAFRLMSSN